MKSIIAIALASLIISACQPKVNSTNELATAFGHKLYLSDVSSALHEASNHLDSTQIITKYVDNWLMSEILYNEAKKELSSADQIDNLVEDYKKSLYIHELEKQKLQELDTAIINSEVISSIKQSESKPTLEEPCLRLLLVKVNKEVYNDTLKSIWKTEDLPALDIYVKQVGGLALLNVGKWYFKSEFNNITPAELRNKIDFSKTASYSLSQDGQEILLKILEYRKTNEPEPEELTIPRVKQKILHDKSNLFLKEWKKTLYQNNIQSKNIHINNN